MVVKCCKEWKRIGDETKEVNKVRHTQENMRGQKGKLPVMGL